MPVASGRRGNRPYRAGGALFRLWCDAARKVREFAVSAKSEWRKALQETNALGWIAFMLLVIGIGIWTIFFSATPAPVKDSVQVTNSSAPKNPK